MDQEQVREPSNKRSELSSELTCFNQIIASVLPNLLSHPERMVLQHIGMKYISATQCYWDNVNSCSRCTTRCSLQVSAYSQN